MVSGVLTDVLTLAVTSLAPLADVLASVLDDVIETSARTVFDSLWELAQNLIMTVKMIVKSGLLPFLVAVGVDFLIIYYVYYALPMFLATIDFINCMMQLVMPSTWPEQLRCAEIKCFTGPEAASDLLIFTSYSRYAGYLADGLEALSNGATARGFGKGDSTGMIGNFLGNSVFGALDTIREFAEMADVPASAEECEACFNCKVRPAHSFVCLRACVLACLRAHDPLSASTLHTAVSGAPRGVARGGLGLFDRFPHLVQPLLRQRDRALPRQRHLLPGRLRPSRGAGSGLPGVESGVSDGVGPLRPRPHRGVRRPLRQAGGTARRGELLHRRLAPDGGGLVVHARHHARRRRSGPVRLPGLPAHAQLRRRAPAGHRPGVRPVRQG